MLADVVVDTNVWVHASNPSEIRFEASLDLMERLRNVPTGLCIDGTFSLDERKNDSLIGAEYLQHIRFGTAGYTTLVQILQQERLREVKRKLPDKERRYVNHLGLKPRDRTFLAVAFNSEQGVLVSHDYEDFPTAKRIQIRQQMEIYMVDAADCCERLGQVVP